MTSQIAVTSDVLVLVVPLREGYAYPSVNHLTAGAHGGGKKTPAYAALAEDVEAAGREARAQGWEPVQHPCRAWFTLNVKDGYRRDAGNIGKCESDALTRATVWTDDELVRPVQLDIVRDAGPMRVVIVVQRLPPPFGHEVPVAPSRPRPGRIVKAPPAWNATQPIPDGYAVSGGKLVPLADALALLRKDGKI